MNTSPQIAFLQKEIIELDLAIEARKNTINLTRTGDQSLQHGISISKLIDRRQEKMDKLESLL